jgi:predicted DNA-binding transcriptional regulator AlpA
MDQREWSVLIEAWAPKGKRGSLDPTDSRVTDLVDSLASLGGAVAAGPKMWSARVTVKNEFIEQAIADAGRIVVEAAGQCRLPAWPIERVEAVEATRLDAELEVSNFPDLVGTTEVAEMLGVSRQRIHELRKADRFPLPMIELAAGPIWLRSAVTAYEERWNRRPGRPALRANERGPGPEPNTGLPNLLEGAHGTR